MAEIVLRPATVADVDAVIALWSVAGENAGRPGDSARDVTRLLDRDPEALVLAVDDGRLAASVIVGWDGWRCHLYRLAVHPDHRRRGIARMLLTHAEQRFTEAGGKRADAMVLDDNTLGAAVWQAGGYAPQPDWSRWVKKLDEGRASAASEDRRPGEARRR